MRLWALVPLLASSGCLFLDDLNHAPTVSITTDLASTIKGSTLTVHADGKDQEDGANLTYRFKVLDGSGPLAACDYDAATTGQYGSSYAVTFYRTGVFTIDVTVVDSSNAPAEAQAMVTITDAPPQFVDKAKVAPSTAGDACNLFAAGDLIPIALSGPTPGVAAVGDADADAFKLGCSPSETLTYTWRISDWPGGAKPVLTAFDGLGCASPTASSGLTLAVPGPTSQVCLQTDPTLTGATAMYRVVLDVSDGTTTVTSPAGDVAVGADEPPCITGTDPLAGSYVVDRTQLQEFGVDGVVDDRDVFGVGIGFVWSVWREADPTWRTVPSWNLSTYQLDVSSFGVGEKVRVRVEAFDRTGALAPPSVCAPDADDCIVYSCASLPNVCHKWKTWDLELR